MSRPLKVLLVEDVLADAELVLARLRRIGYAPDWRRVDTEHDYLAALELQPDIVLCDYSLPQFDAPRAIDLLREHGLEIPLIVISGTIGEDIAVRTVTHGATDYLLKGHLERLGPAIERALELFRLRSENQAALDALRASERDYRMLLEQAADGIVVADAEARVLTVNARASSMFGYTPGQMWGRPMSDFIDVNHLATHPIQLRSLLAGQTIVNERLLRGKGGTLLPVETSSKQFSDGRVQVMIRDISERKQAQDALRAAEIKYRTLVEQIPAAMYTENIEGSIATYMSPQIERMTGYPPSYFVASDRFWKRITHPVDHERVRAELDRAIASGEPFNMEYRVLTRDGRFIWLRDEAVLVEGSADQPPHWQGFLLDITERKEAEAATAELAAVVANATDAITGADTEGRTIIWNHGAELLYGYRAEEALGQSVELIIPESLRDENQAHRQRILNGEPTIRFETVRRRKDGSLIDVNMSVTPLRDAGGRITGMSAISQDITERKRFERQLEQQMFYDTLTGLPNRALFQNRLDQALAQAAQERSAVAILIFSLDRLDTINQSLGYAAGDVAIRTIAGRLAGAIRSQDTVARLSGHEFAILLVDISQPSIPVDRATRVIAEIQAPVTIDDAEAFLSTNVGIAIDYPKAGVPDTILRDASAALLRARAHGHGHFEIFDLSMQTQALQRVALEADLRHAIERGELRVVYQPIVSLSTNSIVAAEALIRWEHPDRGLLTPAEFIPLAEESGLIVQLDRFVLAEACGWVREWNLPDDDGRTLYASVNLSATNLRQPDLVQFVAEVLASTGLAPDRLQFELTETILLEDVERTLETMNGLKALGVRLAIDDFGTGYSSLSYLTRFPIDVVKIDRTFISGLGPRDRMMLMVAGIADLCHSLRFQVTAEGIETSSQLEQAHAAGCDTGQGYFFSRPVSAQGFALTFRHQGPWSVPRTTDLAVPTHIKS